MVVTITVALAALAVLAGIVAVAVGGGGELSAEHPDHPPLTLPWRRAAGGTDAALLRLPMGLWGYHKQITDQALGRFAHELTERDTRIAVLEQELAEARQRLGEDPRRPGPGGSRAERPEWGERQDRIEPAAPPYAIESGRPAGAYSTQDTLTDTPASAWARSDRSRPAPPRTLTDAPAEASPEPEPEPEPESGTAGTHGGGEAGRYDSEPTESDVRDADSRDVGLQHADSRDADMWSAGSSVGEAPDLGSRAPDVGTTARRGEDPATAESRPADEDDAG